MLIILSVNWKSILRYQKLLEDFIIEYDDKLY